MLCCVGAEKLGNCVKVDVDVASRAGTGVQPWCGIYRSSELILW